MVITEPGLDGDKIIHLVPQVFRTLRVRVRLVRREEREG